MRNFRLLMEPEIECRIAEIRKDGRSLSLLLYKTARTDAAMLDEVYGPENWQNDFKILDGKLYGGIGIPFGDQWVWRWDCGTESNMEAEKGQASDAFKRAGFKWGIGAELYTSPRITVPSDKCNIKEYGGKKIKFICIIAAPEGIKKLHEAHPDVDIYIGHIDRELNENAYICPGLGDAGDRIFGTL